MGRDSQASTRMIDFLPGSLLIIAMGLVLCVAQDRPLVQKGRVLYEKHCVSCHGKSAEGDGPAASALKVPPADLTRIKRKNNGFPQEKVESWIDGEKYAVGHGSRTMPVWGKRFSDHSPQGEIPALAKYLETIQRN
jgi:mono/diheme cytochrome c family protein